jgi:SMI1-KNR4 cell-wall
MEARAAGLVERLPPLSPVSPEAIAEAERALSYPFPGLLRRLLLEVGNGGFGPGYGVIGVRGGATDPYERSVLDAHREFHSLRREQSLSDALLPVCDWGCGIVSLVDCASTHDDMWACDPNPGVDDDTFRQPLTLGEWLARWVEGRLYQPALIEDPETGRVRSGDRRGARSVGGRAMTSARWDPAVER